MAPCIAPALRCPRAAVLTGRAAREPHLALPAAVVRVAIAAVVRVAIAAVVRVAIPFRRSGGGSGCADYSGGGDGDGASQKMPPTATVLLLLSFHLAGPKSSLLLWSTTSPCHHFAHSFPNRCPLCREAPSAGQDARRPSGCSPTKQQQTAQSAPRAVRPCCRLPALMGVEAAAAEVEALLGQPEGP